MAGLDLRLTRVSCRHGRVDVVSDVDLDVRAGQRVAVTGTNGSGKTTLLRAVIGLHEAVRGEISIGGRSGRTSADYSWRRRVCGWVPQRPAAGRFPLLAGELLASSGDAQHAQAMAARLGVGELLGRPLDTLSGGQLQRMHLARAVGCVAAGAGVVLADEPTAALDFAGQEEAAEVLAELPVTLIVVTHDRALARRCDRVLEMAAGRLRELS
ncbi:ABC transporter ATP-binding protein [Nocardia amamiensis]|uniref:ABC transporter ATP-binding protein n=1 Tax=Nocardia amamiensis TaxID=404578 RepID=UPI00083215B5|nr:ABC transporter ATP-binding protein [Nocardia amamiensis]